MFFTLSKEKMNSLFSHLQDVKPDLFEESVRDNSCLIIAEAGNDEVSILFFEGENVSEYRIPAIIDDSGYAAVCLNLLTDIVERLSDVDGNVLEIYSDNEMITIHNGQVIYNIANNLEQQEVEDYSNEECIELSLEDLHQMIEDNREREIGLEELLLMQENNASEAKDKEGYNPLKMMRESLQKGNYSDAFISAEELKYEEYANYREEIDDCILRCANAGVTNASIYLLNRLNNGDKLRPDFFPFLRKLAIEGYIPSFRWLADCYEKGIGCKKDIKKAQKLYFEGMLFENNDYCLYKWDCKYSTLYENMLNSAVKEAVDKIDESGYWYGQESRVKIAELILDGMLREYDSESAYIIFKGIDCNLENYSCISCSRLAFCVLNGIGTRKDPIVALKIFEEFEEDFEYVLKYWDDEWNLEYIEDQIYNCKEDFIRELDNTKEMIKEAKKQIKELDEYKIWLAHDGLTDEDDIYDAWKKENPLYIRRNDISWLED